MCAALRSFVSRYLNDAAASEQRATVLSFRGLSTNFSYGIVSLLYSALIAGIRMDENVAAYGSEEAYQNAVFIDSLGWFPYYFLFTVVMMFVLHRLRFPKTKGFSVDG